MNPLFQNTNPMNGIQGFMQRFNQFRQTFSGDPQQKVQEMLNSGRVSQDQYNAAYQQAKNIMNMLNK